MLTKRIFLSGRFDVGDSIEKAWLARTGCKYRCFTFANLDKVSTQYNKRVIESLKVCEDQKISIMMDSGAAGLHNIQRAMASRNRLAVQKHSIDTTQIAEDMFQRYVKYCLKNKSKWTFYVTLDFKKHQPTIFAMQERFEKEGLRPCPVFHGDSTIDWLNKYADKGYKLIGLGTLASARSRHSPKTYRYFLEKVFDRAAKLNLNLHGLAITSLSLMTQFPWWSVDSASWTKTASYGSLLFPNVEKNTIENIHVSTRSSSSAHSYGKMSKRHQQHITEHIATLGFDIKELREDVKARHDFNGWVFSNLNAIIDYKKVESVRWETLL